MPKLIISYPLSSIRINQPFGANAAYYEQHFGQQGHPGIDFAAYHGQPIFAAHDGYSYAIPKDAHGGEGIWVYSLDGTYITIYWHLIGDTDPKYPPVIPQDYQRHPVKKGDLIGYADNTGAPFESSGDHLHFGLMLAINDVPTNTDNGTQGCVDPQPYFDGTYAHQETQDAPQTVGLATIQDDVVQVSKAVRTAPTPQILAKAKQALFLVSQMIASLWS